MLCCPHCMVTSVLVSIASHRTHGGRRRSLHLGSEEAQAGTHVGPPRVVLCCVAGLRRRLVACLGSRVIAAAEHHLLFEFASGGWLADDTARSWGQLEDAAIRAYARDMVARGCAMGGSAGGEHVVGGDRGRGAARALTKTMLFFRPSRRSLRYSGQGWNSRIVTSWGACWRRRRRWGDGATTWSCRPTGFSWRRRDHTPFLWSEIFLRCDCDGRRVGKKQRVRER